MPLSLARAPPFPATPLVRPLPALASLPSRVDDVWPYVDVTLRRTLLSIEEGFKQFVERRDTIGVVYNGRDHMHGVAHAETQGGDAVRITCRAANAVMH